MRDDVGVPSYPESLVGASGRYERWDFERHTPGFVELCADARVMRFLGGRQRADAAEEVSRRIADHWETFGFGLWAAIAADGELAGFVGASRPGPGWEEPVAEATEVGWRLSRRAWGHGFATEGGRLALRFGAEHLGLKEMISLVDPANDRSLAVAQRLGMRRRSQTLNRRLGVTVDVLAVELAVAAVAA